MGGLTTRASRMTAHLEWQCTRVAGERAVSADQPAGATLPCSVVPPTGGCADLLRRAPRPPHSGQTQPAYLQLLQLRCIRLFRVGRRWRHAKAQPSSAASQQAQESIHVGWRAARPCAGTQPSARAAPKAQAGAAEACWQLWEQPRALQLLHGLQPDGGSEQQ